MTTYRIFNRVSGQDFGLGEAESPEEALRLMAEEGGGVFVSDPAQEPIEWAHMIHPDGWIVEEVQPPPAGLEAGTYEGGTE